MSDDRLREASDAIDRACADLQSRDPEQAARFDAQIERTEQALGSGLFERAHETIQVTYERAAATTPHQHNADRTRENGWAYWRCTGCGELCHYVPTPPIPEVYAFCPCCAVAGTMPCLACGDPCLPTEHGEHIRAKHPACPVCLVIEGSALGTGCTCDKTA